VCISCATLSMCGIGMFVVLWECLFPAGVDVDGGNASNCTRIQSQVDGGLVRKLASNHCRE
jgi:hypothetical protein